MNINSINRYKLAVLLLAGIIFSIICIKPFPVKAGTANGRMNAMVLGHASGEDLDFYLYMEVGNTRYETINPRYWIVKEIDGRGLISAFIEDDYIDKHNKEYVKEKKGYKLEAVSADSSIVKVITKPGGAYSAKGIKEGRTVIKFYETYLGKKHYLGCREVVVGPGDMVDETLTMFIGSELFYPTAWATMDHYMYDTSKNTDVRITPENKQLFSKITYDSGLIHYRAKQVGETKASIMIRGKKKSFNIKIIEPVLSKQAKLTYSLNSGYVIYTNDILHLFDYSIEDELLEYVSDDPDIAEIKYTKVKSGWHGHFIYTKQSGTAHIKVNAKIGGKSKYLGEIVIKVLETDTSAYADDLVPSTNNEQNDVSYDETDIDSEIDVKDDNSTKDKIWIVNKVPVLKVGESYQFEAGYSEGVEFCYWSVSGDSEAYINGETGLLTALTPGNTTVTVEGEYCLDSYELKVIENDLESTKGKGIFDITGSSVISGEDYAVYTTNAYGVTWSVSNPDLVILEPDDAIVKIYPLGKGSFTLYVDTDTHHGQMSITIK